MKKFILITFALLVFFHLKGLAFETYLKASLQKPGEVSRYYISAVQTGDSLLVLTNKNTIDIIDLNTLQTFSLPLNEASLQTRLITSLCLSPQGEIIIGSEKGLYRLTPSTGIVQQFDKSLPNLLVKDLAYVGKDLLILFPTRLVIHNGSAWKDVDLKRFNYLGEFFKLEKSRDGSLTIAAEQGTIFITPLGEDVKTKPVLGGKTLDIHANQYGKLFILSEKKLFQYKNGKISPVSSYTKEGKLFTDQLGQPWIYSPKQMYVCSKGTIAPIKLPEEIVNEEITGVFHCFTPTTYILTKENLYIFKAQPHNPVKFYTTLMDSLLSDLNYYLLPPQSKVFSQLWHNYDQLYFRHQIALLQTAIGVKSVYQKAKPDFNTLISRITNLSDKKVKTDLLEQLRLAALQNDPDLAVYISRLLSKMAVRPDEIIQSKTNLAKAYLAAGQPGLAEAVYRQTGFNFPLTTPGVDKALFAVAELTDNPQEKADIWGKFTNYHSDPIVSAAKKYFYYDLYCSKKFESIIGSLPREQKIIHNTPPDWRIFGANIGVYAIDDRGQVFYSDPTTLNWSAVSGIRGAKKIVNSSLGNLLLLESQKVLTLSPTGANSPQPTPPMQGKLLNIWSNRGLPVMHTSTHIIAYNENTGGWEALQIPAELRRFQFLNIIAEGDGYWYVCTPAKIYRFRQAGGQVEGLPTPPEIISIRGVAPAPGSGFYLATNNGLYLFQDEQFQLVDISSGFDGKDVTSIIPGKKSSQIVLLADSTAWVSSPGGWITLLNRQSLPIPQISNIAIDNEGFLYCLQNARILVWDLGQHGSILDALNASRTASSLFRNSRYSELEQYLNRLSRHPQLAAWALEFLGRAMLAQGKYDLALEQYQIAGSSDRNNYWVTDSATAALIYQLIKKGRWSTAIKGLAFLQSKFGQSPLIPYTCRLVSEYLVETPFSSHLSEKTEMLLWWFKNYPQISRKNGLNDILLKMALYDLHANRSSGILKSIVKQTSGVQETSIFLALLQHYAYQKSDWSSFQNISKQTVEGALPMWLKGQLNEFRLSVFLREKVGLL